MMDPNKAFKQSSGQSSDRDSATQKKMSRPNTRPAISDEPKIDEPAEIEPGQKTGTEEYHFEDSKKMTADSSSQIQMLMKEFLNWPLRPSI